MHPGEQQQQQLLMLQLQQHVLERAGGASGAGQGSAEAVRSLGEQQQLLWLQQLQQQVFEVLGVGFRERL